MTTPTAGPPADPTRESDPADQFGVRRVLDQFRDTQAATIQGAIDQWRETLRRSADGAGRVMGDALAGALGPIGSVFGDVLQRALADASARRRETFRGVGEAHHRVTGQAGEPPPAAPQPAGPQPAGPTSS